MSKIEQIVTPAAEALAAHGLAALSGIGQHLPNFARKVVGLGQDTDVIMRWNATSSLQRGSKLVSAEHVFPHWAIFKGNAEANPLDPRGWRLGVLAVDQGLLQEELNKKRRPAVAYRFGEIAMIGVSNLPPYEDDFLRPLAPPNETDERWGVIVRIGKGDFQGTIGTIDGHHRTFRSVPTEAIEMNELSYEPDVLANTLLRV